MTKQDILQEIQRTTSANGGQPLGIEKFKKETGIKTHEWCGKYWVRWSDALKEAGFAPNQMQESYEEDFLFEKLIELAREIGHFPVEGELKMKTFKDKEFPTSRTFAARFGRKNQLVSKVTEYCRERTGFEDVIRMCEAASPKNRSDEGPKEESEVTENIGSVYLMKHARFYKIGKTNSMGRREYDLSIQMPEKLTTVHVIKTDDPDGIEAYWHKRFAPKRKNGEWFDLNSSEIKAFKKWLRIV